MKYEPIWWITHTFYPIVSILAFASGPSNLFGLAILMAFVEALKRIVGELRPDKSDYRSFPSGHSATAWYVASVFDWHWLVSAWAIAVSASRYIKRRHFIHDILVGAALGILAGHLVRRFVPKITWKTVTRAL